MNLEREVKKTIPTVIDLVERKTQEEAAASIAAMKKPIGQWIVCAALLAAADKQSGSRNAVPSLADTIVAQHKRKVRQYGNKAFPLSEKQIGVIVRDTYQSIKG